VYTPISKAVRQGGRYDGPPSIKALRGSHYDCSLVRPIFCTVGTCKAIESEQLKLEIDQ